MARCVPACIKNVVQHRRILWQHMARHRQLDLFPKTISQRRKPHSNAKNCYLDPVRAVHVVADKPVQLPSRLRERQAGSMPDTPQ
eukprot:2320362-Rhodomonas_salina.3